MLCHKRTDDTRGLRLSYGCHISEAADLFIDLRKTPEDSRNYFMQTCKECRGAFIQMLIDWQDERVALRELEPEDDESASSDWGEIRLRDGTDIAGLILCFPDKTLRVIVPENEQGVRFTTKLYHIVDDVWSIHFMPEWYTRERVVELRESEQNGH